MKRMRFFPRFKKTNNYLLEIVETPTKKSVARSHAKGGFSYGKKLLVSLLLGVLAVTGTGTAAMAATVDAKTANAFEIDIFRGFCSTLDTPGAFLGGTSPTLVSGWNQEVRNSPQNNGINISILSEQAQNPYVTGKGTPVSGVKWTALEQYGYYAPSFESWKGQLYEKGKNGNDDIWPFAGTGGSGKVDEPGQIVAITNPVQSPMYLRSSGDCLWSNWNPNVGIGNFVFFITKFSVALASETYGIASNVNITSETSPLHGLVVGITDLITGGDNPDQGLRQLLFLDWLIVIIVVGTFGLILNGIIRRRGLKTLQDALWMIGASITGMLLLFNPMLIPTVIDDFVGEISSSVTGAMLPAGNSPTNLCDVEGSGSDASIRQVKCSIWYSTIYAPWVKGQFGVNEYDLSRYAAGTEGLTGNTLERVNSVAWMFSDGYANADGNKNNVTTWESGKEPDGEGFKGYNFVSADVNAASRGIFSKADIKFGDKAYEGSMNWAIYQLDRQNNWGSYANRGVDYSEIAFNQLVVNKNTIWGGAGDAIGSSITSVFASFGPVIVLMVFGLTLIGYQLSMLFLTALSPAFLLVGVAPGWGRRIAMRWLELLVGLMVKRIVLIIVLVLFVKMYMIIIYSAMDWWIQALMALALVFVVLTQRDRINSIFTDSIDFGGNKAFDGGGEVAQNAKAKGRLALVGAGMLAQKAGGNIAANAAARKHAASLAAQRSGNAAVETTSGKGSGRGKGGSGSTGATSGSGRTPSSDGGTTTNPQVSRKDQRKADAYAASRQGRREQAKKDRNEKVEAQRTKAWQERKANYHATFENAASRRKTLREQENQLNQKHKNGEIDNKEYAKRKRAIAMERKSTANETRGLKKQYAEDAKRNQNYEPKPVVVPTKPVNAPSSAPKPDRKPRSRRS